MPRFRDDFEDDDFDDFEDDDFDEFEEEDSDQEQNSLSEEVHMILNHAEYFELLSLNPDKTPPKRGKGKAKAKARNFHGWPILGLTVLSDEGVRHDLVMALNQGLADWSGEIGDSEFVPRHAFRAVHGHQTADVLISFECHEVAVYLDDGEAEWLHLSERPAMARVYDTVFRAAGLPRAE